MCPGGGPPAHRAMGRPPLASWVTGTRPAGAAAGCVRSRRAETFAAVQPHTGWAVIRADDHGPCVPPDQPEQVLALFHTPRARGTPLHLAVDEPTASAHRGGLHCDGPEERRAHRAVAARAEPPGASQD